MHQYFSKLNFKTRGIGLEDITGEIKDVVSKSEVHTGMVNLTIMHTSASLLIQENADPSVLKDLLEFYKNLAPIADNYKHKTEGPDDMPAHIKSSLTNTSLTLSIQNEGLILGTWQGIYLFEHRWKRHLRKLNLHYIGEKS